MFDERDLEDVKRSEKCEGSCPGIEDCIYGCRVAVISKSALNGKETIYRPMCQKSIDNAELVRKTDEVRRQQKEIDSVLSSSKLIHLRECVFENFITSRKALILPKHLAAIAVESGKSIVFSGASGVGKTHLALAIADRLVTSGSKSVVFSSFISLLNDFKNSFGAEKTGKTEKIRSILRSAGCLILDDVGQESQTPYSRELMFSLIDERYNMRRQLVVTTNCSSWEALSEKFGERGIYIARRLRDMGNFVRMEKRGVRNGDEIDTA